MSLALYSVGMHDFILAELELGERAALYLDEEAYDPDAWYWDFKFAERVAGREDE